MRIETCRRCGITFERALTDAIMRADRGEPPQVCIDGGNHDPVLGPEITWREWRANRLKKRAGI